MEKSRMPASSGTGASARKKPKGGSSAIPAENAIAGGTTQQ